MDLAQSLGGNKDSVLYVQGTVSNPSLGRSFKHAWVELPKENMVLDPTVDLKMPKPKYYKTFSPKNVIRMDVDVAALLAWKKGGLEFFTKTDVTNMEKHLKEMDERMGKKRK
jgi:hypothetical protein